MPARVLMVQGTASHVGKSTLVTALCRIFRQDGFRVAPFKAQNMSLNSFVTPEGGEIGRAQAVQAEAAGIQPHVDMNPILLKPEADHRSQVVVHGRPMASLPARDYYALNSTLWEAVRQSLDRLRQRYDVVVIEGAGSPAEINLKADDIVNMRVARYASAPVLLVADIDRGGVFASVVGTLELLEPEERALVRGVVINKFRGDRALLEPGLRMLQERTGVPVAGVLPFFTHIHIAEEDSVALESPHIPVGAGLKPAPTLDIAVLRLPRISNFDDFDPLAREPGVTVRFVTALEQLGRPDLLILPGTKTTADDLQHLRATGLADAIVGLARDGTPVIGICGGYQMLGQMLLDPLHVEAASAETPGLGLLPVTTIFAPTKETHQVTGRVQAARGLLAQARGLTFTGYEIHMGHTPTSPDEIGAPFVLSRRPDTSGPGTQHADGAVNAEGTILGTYVHGLFHNDGLRRAILSALAQRKGVAVPTASGFNPDEEYDKLARLVREHLDMKLVYHLCGLEQ